MCGCGPRKRPGDTAVNQNLAKQAQAKADAQALNTDSAQNAVGNTKSQ